MITLRERVAGFLETPPPSALITVSESATKDILSTFARSGALKASEDELLLLDACIASNAQAAEDAVREEEKSHFAMTSRLLSEIKTDFGRRVSTEKKRPWWKVSL